MPGSRPDYDTLRERLGPLVTQASAPQLNNLTLFVFALLTAGHVHLPKVALCLPVPGCLHGARQRLERFLQNPAVAPARWYEGVARALLARLAGGEAELVLDATDLGDRHPMLFVALCFRGRALPILWRMLPREGCSAWAEQRALLERVARLLPPDCRVVLMGDREYGSAPLMRFCRAQGWSFCLRAKCNRWFRLPDGRAFQMRDVPLRPGTSWWEGGVTLDDLPGVRLSLSCGWSAAHKDDEPWYVLSDLAAGREVLARYARRFWIEEMFRDFKEQGFRLEKTRLTDGERVSRLVLCVCIAYVFLLCLGERIEREGKRRAVDRHTKPQLSLFQVGVRYLKRLLTLRQDTAELFCLKI